ncbi:hypothetical protein Phi19:1_gp081 [Cellulophaga phage phi19:1]|uniref:Uncharacterized protein n=1 Tax=Cellulophaga phage phi19:1 TaxID=1327970 RepID=R9ZW95_9CAUD|nr:hypothetical protein Phi19:1_gp081 [Cellulophaga phage phi19:1]AGO47371.1 hypothetical protein Phi19:1_gp081 [Cellulophaga phage phi19:1]
MKTEINHLELLIKYLKHIDSIENSFYTTESEHLNGDAMQSLINIIKDNAL